MVSPKAVRSDPRSRRAAHLPQVSRRVDRLGSIGAGIFVSWCFLGAALAGLLWLNGVDSRWVMWPLLAPTYASIAFLAVISAFAVVAVPLALLWKALRVVF